MTENPRLQFWTKKKPLNKIQENSGKPFNELRNKNQQTNTVAYQRDQNYKKESNRNYGAEEFNK